MRVSVWNKYTMSEEPLPPPTKEIIERVRSEYGLDDQSIKEAVEMVKDWLKLQPHLPQEHDDGRLERWLLRCKNSIEKTKRTLDLYYTLKTATPELMSNWDVRSDWYKKICSLVYCFPAPKLTPDYDRVVCCGFYSKEASEYNMSHHSLMLLTVAEIRMCEDYNISDIWILDLANYNLGHVPKITLPIMKKYETCLMKGFNTRMKALHIVNVPQYGVMLIRMIKTVLSSKIAARIRVHGSDMTSLHKYVPKEILPSELGGDCGPLGNQWGKFQTKIDTYRDWFLEHEKLKSDESKRPGGAMPNDEMFGFEGSFRKLAVD